MKSSMAGKVKAHELSEVERKRILTDFFIMVASLDNTEEVEKFLKDLLTPSEQVMIARRIQIAKMLLSGATHEDIRNKLHVGLTTISLVERWLNAGFGGYKLALRKKKTKNNTRASSSADEPFSFAQLRKKYPAHFLLINLLLKNK
jgi:TrpR-related protein YerC/YecD